MNLRFFRFSNFFLLFLVGALLLSSGVTTFDTAYAGQKIKAGFYSNSPLVEKNKETGKAAGFFVDIFNHIAQQEGWEVEYIYGSWNECEQRLANEEIDVLLDMAYRPQRAQIYHFNDTVVYTNWAQVYTMNGLNIQSIHELQNRSVALINDVYYDEFLNLTKQFNVNCKISLQKNYHDVFKLLSDGKVDVGIVNRSFGSKFENIYGLVKEIFYFSSIKLHFAFRQSIDKTIIEALDKQLVRVQKDRGSIYYTALDQWMGGGVNPWTFPWWLKVLLWSLFILLLLFVAINLILRSRVKSTSEELRSRKVELKMEKSGRIRAQDCLSETEERLRIIFDHSQIAIFLIDEKGSIISANPAVEDIFGYTVSELLNRDFTVLLHQEEIISTKVMFGDLVDGEGERFDTECRLAKKDDSIVWGHLLANRFRQGKKDFRPVLLMIEDISKRKEAETRIQLSLKQREILIHEIHQRAQKNLDIIDSLLDQQSRMSDTEQTRYMFQESRERVQAIVLIHKVLAKSGAINKLEFVDYINELMKQLFTTYNIKPGRIKHQTNIDDLYIDVDQTIMTALLIHELTGNAIRHAFPRERDGIIFVSLKQIDNNLHLTVKDNGIGLPVNFKIHKEKSIGMYVLTTITEELNGKIILNTDEGTAITICFPLTQ